MSLMGHSKNNEANVLQNGPKIISLIHFNIIYITTNMSKPSQQNKFPACNIFELPHYFWNDPYNILQYIVMPMMVNRHFGIQNILPQNSTFSQTEGSQVGPNRIFLGSYPNVTISPHRVWGVAGDPALLIHDNMFARQSIICGGWKAI